VQRSCPQATAQRRDDTPGGGEVEGGRAVPRGTLVAARKPMVTLRFAGLSAFDTNSLVSPAGFRISGNFVRDLVSGHIVAQYRNYHWVIGDHHHSAYECTVPASIFFEDALGGRSDVFGPYQLIRTADGVMYCDAQYFSRFIDESLLWHSIATNTHWPALFIVPPARSPTA
jgi:hypothetical protein